MKKFQKLLIFYLLIFNEFSLTKTIENQNQTKSITKALIDVIRVFYIANNIEFDFIIYGETSKHIEDVINEVTKELSHEIKVNIKNVKFIAKWDYKLEQSAIFMTKSQLNLKYFNFRSITKHSKDLRLINWTPKDFKFLFYVEEIENIHKLSYIIAKFSRFSHNLPTDFRAFEFFLTSHKNSLTLSANVVYSEEFCGEFHLKFLNFFNIKTQKWEKKLENFNHFENYHGCQLSFEIYFNFGPHFYVDEMQKYEENFIKFTDEIAAGNIKFRGLTHELVEMASKRNNFTFNYAVVNKYTDYTVGYKNFVPIPDFRISFHNAILVPKFAGYHWTEPCGSLDYYFLITKNDLYSNYEKVLLPFDFTTWILLFFTNLLTFFIIFGFNRCPKWLKSLKKHFVIKNIAFNTLGVFFGIPQFRVQQRSVNRVLLLFFIWYCLILRTCYQSKLFEFMTSDMRKPLPASIDDLRKMNYTIVLWSTPSEEFENINDAIFNDKERPKIISVDAVNFKSLYNQSIYGKNSTKFAFLINNLVHSYLNATHHKTLATMDNEKITLMTAYIVENDMTIFNKFSSIIHHLLPAGITNYLVDHAIWLLRRPFNVEIVDPRRILSLSDLEFGFVLWIASLSLPIVCFFCEILSVKIKKMRRILIETFLYFLGGIFERILKFIMKNHKC